MRWFRLQHSLFWHYAAESERTKDGPSVFTLCGFFPLRDLISERRERDPGEGSRCPECFLRLQMRLAL